MRQATVRDTRQRSVTSQSLGLNSIVRPLNIHCRTQEYTSLSPELHQSFSFIFFASILHDPPAKLITRDGSSAVSVDSVICPPSSLCFSPATVTVAALAEDVICVSRCNSNSTSPLSAMTEALFDFNEKRHFPDSSIMDPLPSAPHIAAIAPVTDLWQEKSRPSDSYVQAIVPAFPHLRSNRYEQFKKGSKLAHRHVCMHVYVIYSMSPDVKYVIYIYRYTCMHVTYI